MQKKLIALAIAGLASSAAFAADNVTIYGRMDAGYVNEGGNSGDVRTNGRRSGIDSGIQSGSRLGFKGAEELGNGLKAIFEIEANLQATEQSNTSLSAGGLTSRHAYVGLTGNFGTAVIGRLDGVRYGIQGQYNAFGLGTVGQMANLQVHQTRADNAIAYISPSFSGFNVTAAYSNNLTGNDAAAAGSQTVTNGLTTPNANDGHNKLWAIKPAYNNGPLSLTADYEQANLGGVSNNEIRIGVLGGSYDFGVAKVLAYWEKVKADNNYASTAAPSGIVWDQRSWTLGATIPVMVKGLVKVSYGQVSDANNGNQYTGGLNISAGDLTKWAIGFDYALSKRTNLYVDYAMINNKSGNGRGTMAVSGYNNSLDGFGAASSANGTGGGFGTTGFDVGIAHNF